MTETKIKTFYQANGARHYEHPLAFEPPTDRPFTGHPVGVTSVINAIAKPFIVQAAAKTAAVYAVNFQADWQALPTKAAKINDIKGAFGRYTGEASDLGTQVHEACEATARYLFFGGPAPDLFEHIRPYVARYVQFLEEMEARPVHLERTTWHHTLGYAGTFDGLFTLGGRPALAVIDTKSGASGTWPEVALQQSAYVHAECIVNPDGTEEEMPHIEEAYALWLRPQGYALKPLKIREQTWLTFQALLQVVKWQNECEATVIGKAINPNPLLNNRKAEDT